jgi:phosphinothricin acetyltransferase
MIREMENRDSVDVLRIFGLGIESGNATFDPDIPAWTEWDSNHLRHSRLVFEENGKVLGWAALSPVSSREAYRGVAEVSIYVNTDFLGKGIGTELMERLILSSEENGIWSLYSGIFPENVASIKLHEKFGFRIFGSRERIACHNGRWRDTVALERRSTIIGI